MIKLSIFREPRGMARAAKEFWTALSPRRRAFVLWDLPGEAPRGRGSGEGGQGEALGPGHDDGPARRGGRFAQCLSGAFETALWTKDFAPVALAWALPLTLGAPACAVHFHFAAPGKRLFPTLARQYLEATAAPSLVGLLPETFRGIRPALASIGLKPVARLPGACRLAPWGQTRAGYLYAWSREGTAGD